MKIKLPDIVQDDYRVGSRQDEDFAVPRTLEPLISSEGVKLQMWDLVEVSSSSPERKSHKTWLRNPS